MKTESSAGKTEALSIYYKAYGIASEPELSKLKFDEEKLCYGERAIRLLQAPEDIIDINKSILLWVLICLTITVFEIWLFRERQSKESV